LALVTKVVEFVQSALVTKLVPSSYRRRPYSYSFPVAGGFDGF